MSVNDVGAVYSETQRVEEAEKVLKEALQIRRELSRSNPSAGLPDVFQTLTNLSILYGGTQRLTEAETGYSEVLQAYRELAKANPLAYLGDVAATLNHLGGVHRDMQRLCMSKHSDRKRPNRPILRRCEHFGHCHEKAQRLLCRI